MNRILVGVDGSPESIKAVALAAEVAEAMKAKMTLAFAVEPADAIFNAPELSARAADDETRERATAETTTKLMASNVPKGLSVETAVLSGPPAFALADLAEKAKFDLVVVGHRGRNAVARSLLGSVADRLTQISPVPVLVVR
jgi:nucleotide-binding universal stress UspA family protein